MPRENDFFLKIITKGKPATGKSRAINLIRKLFADSADFEVLFDHLSRVDHDEEEHDLVLKLKEPECPPSQITQPDPSSNS